MGDSLMKKIILTVVLTIFLVISCNYSDIESSNTQEDTQQHESYKEIKDYKQFFKSSEDVYVGGMKTGLKNISANTVTTVFSGMGVRKRSANINSSYDLSKWLPPIENQGKQGSCVGFAWGYYYKTILDNIEHNRTSKEDRSNPDNICSPAFVFNMIQSGTGQDSMPDDGFKVLNDFGCSSLSKMPYDDTNYTKWPTKSAYLDAIKRKTKAPSGGEFNKIALTSDSAINQVKKLIANDQPVVFGIKILEKFASKEWSNFNDVVSVARKRELGKNKGGHAQCIVGYDDNKDTPDGKGAFKVANSWGKEWGNIGGFYWISYEAIKKDSGIVPDGEALWVEDRIGYSSGKVVQFKFTSSDGRSSKAKLSLGNRTKDFFDFHAMRSGGGMGQAQSKPVPFPDHEMVIDVKEWERYFKEGETLKLTLNSSGSNNGGYNRYYNSTGNSSIDSFSYVNLSDDSEISSDETPVNATPSATVSLTIPDGQDQPAKTDETTENSNPSLDDLLNIAPVFCDSASLEKCTTRYSCQKMGFGFWYGGKCKKEKQMTCDTYNIEACETKYYCEELGFGYWYKGKCNEDAPKLCDSGNLENCESKSYCEKLAYGYWYNQQCNKDEQISDSSNENESSDPINEMDPTDDTETEENTVNEDNADKTETSDENQTKKMKVFTSSTFSTDYVASNLVDGTDQGWFSRDIYSPYQQEWIRVEFGSDREVSQVEIDWIEPYIGREISLYNWENGQWKFIGRTQKLRQGSTILAGNKLSTSSIMITFSGAYDRWYGIKEIVVK